MVEKNTVVYITAILGAIVIAALIVVFSGKYAWTIIFTTFIILYFGYLILKINKK